MGVLDQYRAQLPWRDWPTAFAALPPLKGQRVLDLGCGIGDQAAELVARGATVIGIDGLGEALEEARARGLERATFLQHDLRELPALDAPADGIWSSFAVAYFPDLVPVLRAWARALAPGGWIALTEMDDFFGHEPLSDRTRELLASYADESRAAGRYDFHSGRGLDAALTAAGFTIERSLELPDAELAFDGPARPEVVEAWRTRLEQMKLLHQHCGKAFEAVRDDFLACLGRPDHRSTCRVCFRLARRG
jgi:SAM-dependent methyltransferase